MELYLIQHGLARSSQEDPQRPLNERGRNESMTVAQWIARGAKAKPEHIYHSGKPRARETAEIFAEQLGASSAVESASHLSPTDDPEIWLERVMSMDTNAMLVGHMPHISRLASLILIGNPEKPVIKVVNSGVICLERVENDHWLLTWMIVPRLLNQGISE